MPALLQRIYSGRGIEAKEALETDLKSLLPFDSLKDINKGAQRLYRALCDNERILFVGDFDADGATSTALGVSALKAFGAKHVEYLVPNRFEYGYGLTPEIVEVSRKWTPSLIITVDNGIASIEGVKAANQHGIDVVVTDHHLSADTLPDAAAIINPNQPGCPFQSKSIAGVGVIFYLLLALRRHCINENYFAEKGIDIPNMGDFLDLVALGTIADVVPLDKNNRILASQGLKRIRAGRAREGIKALLAISKREVAFLQSSDLGFSVAPRLNAAGRLDDMSLGIECLLSTDTAKSRLLAKELDELNVQRREIEQEMKSEAFDVLKRISLKDESLPLGVCLFDATWHQGVIGILAGRLKERHHRPVVIFAKVADGELKGSARSIPGLNIRDLFDVISKKDDSLISTFGGHAMAAGLSIKEKNFSKFKKAFEKEASHLLNADDCIETLYTDGPLSHEDLSIETAKLVENLGPWGQSFPEPSFDNEFELVEQRLLANRHLKMTVSLEEGGPLIDAIAFNINNEVWPNYRCKKIRAVYRLGVNRYRGRERLQLMFEHFTPT